LTDVTNRYILAHKEDTKMAITIIICASVVVSIALISFGSFCKEHPSEAARIFEREKDDPNMLKIWLKEGEKKKYREFIFRHGYEEQESIFVKYVLFKSIQEYDLAILDGEKESLKTDPLAWLKFIGGAIH
jgi:hypothetical protein